MKYISPRIDDILDLLQYFKTFKVLSRPLLCSKHLSSEYIS